MFFPSLPNPFLRLGSFSRLGLFFTSLALLSSSRRRRSSRRLLLGLVLLGSTLGLVAFRRSPQGQVVTQELHDQSAVPVAFLGQRVELSNGVIERLLGQVAGTVGRVEDFIVEDGEVEGETETDGVRGGQVSLGNVGGVLSGQYYCPLLQTKQNQITHLVGLVGGGSGDLALAARSKLGQITVVVTLPVFD